MKLGAALCQERIMGECLLKVGVKKLSVQVTIIALCFDTEEERYFRKGCQFSSFIGRKKLAELLAGDSLDGC